MTKVQREIVLPVDRERAWESITRPDELEEWLADEVELDLEEGGEVVARWDDGETRRGVVEAVEDERRLWFSWGDEADRSEVRFTLDDDPEGTRLTVVELRRAPALRPLASWGPRLDALAHASALCPA